MSAIIQQLLFSAGPIALAMMGAYVSISPPSQKQRFIWITGFIIVGIVSAFFIFLEVRGTDTAIDNLLGQIAILQKQTKRNPRFEFAGIKTSTAADGSILATPQFSNTSNVDAISYRMVSSIARRTMLPTQGDMDLMDKELSKYPMRSIPNGIEISRGMGVSASPMRISKDTIDNDRGNGPFYLLAIAEYAEKEPDNNGDYWRTEVCAKITKLFTDFEACPVFNQYLHMRNHKSLND
jgi:hypothetical protein